MVRILPSILKREVQRQDPPLVEILTPLWPRVAGKAMAACCRPVAFEAGTLTLATDSDTWSTQLRLLSEEIRAEINGFFGAPVVRRVRIRNVRCLAPAAARLKAKPGARPGGLPPQGAADSASALARALAHSYVQGITRRPKKGE